ncbi:MAG: APC family permease [Xanthomonadaceae bacterium]|nr:APC family permease [Xanthomonadaceae bacterium]
MSRTTPEQASAELDAAGYTQELDRRLKLRHLLVYGMVFIVPIAPVAVYGFVAHASHGMVPLVYLVGMVAMFFTALSYKQLSAEFPFAGSVYAYVRRGMNPFLGFVAGWMILADYLLVPAVIYIFVSNWLGGLVPGVPHWVWIVALLAVNTAINVLGVRLQSHAHFVLLALELIALAIFVVLAIRFVFVLGHGTGGFSWAPLYQPGHLSWSFIATATTIAALSFLGFDAISTLAEESREPRRDIGTATVLTLVVLGALFVLQTWLAALAHPVYANLDDNLGFFQIAREVGGTALFVLFIVVKALATGVASALASQSAISRILFAMGRDRALPYGGFLSRVNPRFKTPANAILFVAVLSLVLSLSVPIVVLLHLVNFGALTSFLLLNLSVPVYFWLRRRERSRPLRHLVLPICGLAVVGFIFTGFDRTTFLFGGAWLAVGLLVGVLRGRDSIPFEASP